MGIGFYGAAGAVLGIEEQRLQHGAAVVQQVQDYNNSQLPGNAPISKADFVSNLVRALATGCCDRSDDPAPIAGGFKYGKDVYLQDPERQNKSDSCTSTPASTSPTGFNEGPAGAGFDHSFKVSIPMQGDSFVENSVVEVKNENDESDFPMEIRTTDTNGEIVLWVYVDGEWVRVTEAGE